MGPRSSQISASEIIGFRGGRYGAKLQENDFQGIQSQSIRHRLQKLYLFVNVSNFLEASTFVK